uniref:Uncharacterized protein n=1 Tax=Macaca fascicularis TaxID=9541 RepID=A0A7N9D7D3_MACFA
MSHHGWPLIQFFQDKAGGYPHPPSLLALGVLHGCFCQSLEAPIPSPAPSSPLSVTLTFPLFLRCTRLSLLWGLCTGCLVLSPLGTLPSLTPTPAPSHPPALSFNVTLGWAQWLTPVIPAPWGAKADHLRSGVGDQPGQHDETLSLLKNTKINWAWCVPVSPATREAEAGESLEPWRQRLQ